MELYSGHIDQFIEQATQNQIAILLQESFFSYFGYHPPEAEVRSWKNSLRTVKDVFESSGFHDHGIFLEYQLPLSSKRLDCMVCGTDQNKNENAVIIELKQWESCEAGLSDKVVTWTGGGNREVLHPSVQVGNYASYLEDNHLAFHGEDPVALSACAYLHNYSFGHDDPILSGQFSEYLDRYPLFSSDDFFSVSQFLQQNLSNGAGIPVLEKIKERKYAPSKKLLFQVSKVIKGNDRYDLLDDQLIAFDKVMTSVKAGLEKNRKRVILIKGGPGTGKSVIAINLMAELSSQGLNVQYATGSKAFTETLRKTIGGKGKAQFKYFNSYINAEENIIDVLIADESHRIRATSNNRYTPKVKRSSSPQIDELISVSKLPVFFIDDLQAVRPGEIGSSEYIKSTAERMGCELFEYQLDIQFRCLGSDRFVQWIDNTLELRKTAEKIWDSEINEFEFKIMNSPHELYAAIKQKNDETPNSARMVAGFCWKWSNPNPDGTLVKDVVIDDFAMTWEGKDSGGRLAPGVPPAALWPYEPAAVSQIGSIYTIQGFEFEYVGVIIGKDIMYSFDQFHWEGHPENSADTVVKRSGDSFLNLVKNTYRVLLSRALKGCYVYFVDKDTEKFFRTRMC